MLEKYNKVWDKVSNIMKKECDSEPVYSERYLKIKIELCERKINTNFYNAKVPKVSSQCICLSVILIDCRSGKSYYPQVFLEECKYIFKEKKKYITDHLKISTNDDNSDEKNYSERYSDEENFF